MENENLHPLHDFFTTGEVLQMIVNLAQFGYCSKQDESEAYLNVIESLAKFALDDLPQQQRKAGGE